MPEFEVAGDRFGARVTYSAVPDEALNRSVITVEKVEVRSVASLPEGYYWIKGSIHASGQRCATLSMTDSKYCKVKLSRQYAGGGAGSDGFSGFSASAVAISHNGDGTAPVEFTVKLSLFYEKLVEITPGISEKKQIRLEPIQRVSKIKTSGNIIGSPMTIELQRAAEGAADSITWRCGEKSGTIIQKTTEESVQWVIPEEIAPADSQEAALFLSVSSFLDGALIGKEETRVLCWVPQDAVPTVQVEVTDGNGYAEQYGGYIQNRSRVRVRSIASGVMGATVERIDVSFDTLKTTGSDVAFNPDRSGTMNIYVTATDSRGKWKTVQTQIDVLPYEPPRVVIRDACRCGSDGTEQADGGWMKVVFDGSVTAIPGSAARYLGCITIHGGTESTMLELTDYTGHSRVTGGMMLCPAALDKGYDCRIVAADAFTETQSQPVFLAVAFALMDFCKDQRAIGIGIRARNASRVSFGLDADMEEHRIENMAEPVQQNDAVTKGYTDRIGQSVRTAMVKLLRLERTVKAVLAELGMEEQGIPLVSQLEQMLVAVAEEKMVWEVDGCD